VHALQPSLFPYAVSASDIKREKYYALVHFENETSFINWDCSPKMNLVEKIFVFFLIIQILSEFGA
jgi:hypothetical protein